MSALPSPLKSPTSALTPGRDAKVPNSPMIVLVTLKLPSPLEKATGTEIQPCPPVSAMSALPSPLKSPTSGVTSGRDAKVPNCPMIVLVTLKLPSPLEKATGTDVQPCPPVSAMSALPSPLKSPTSGVTPGRDVQPWPPTSAMSALPSPLKSPTSAVTPGIDAQVPNCPRISLVTLKLPSPLEKATGIEVQPWPPTSAMSAFPSPLKSPTSAVTPGIDAQVPNCP